MVSPVCPVCRAMHVRLPCIEQAPAHKDRCLSCGAIYLLVVILGAVFALVVLAVFALVVLAVFALIVLAVTAVRRIVLGLVV
jgi:hypothetical protein